MHNKPSCADDEAARNTRKDDDNESLATHAWSGCLGGSQDDCFIAGGKQSQSTRSGTAGLAIC
jgi:hypothetical protein